MFRALCNGVYNPKRLVFDGDLTTILCFLETPFLIRPFSTHSSFTVSYLINSCGLSREKAISISKKIQFENSVKPDSVISLFKYHEISNTQISKIIQKHPSVLLVDANKYIKPKMEFLKSLGFSGPDFTKFLSSNPFVLRDSLENTLIPATTFLKSIVHTDNNVISVLKRSPWAISHNPEKRIPPNIAILKDLGVPDCNILKLLTTRPSALMRSNKWFEEIVWEIKKMEFDPLKYAFLKAMDVLSSLKKSSWEARCNIYKKWGWSDEVIHMAFRSQPNCMMLSKKKIMGIFEFLVNKMGYDPLIFARNPTVMTFSIEKRIVPRCLVIHVLILNGLVGKDYNINAALRCSDMAFLEKFVTKFENEVPKLLDVYQGKTNVLL